ncbi:MAG: hypothetical protein NVSMB67_29430 [Flavisolibacter sp.]
MDLVPFEMPINNTIGGFYLGIPSDYHKTTIRYPLLISIAGAGQFGNGSNDLPLLLHDGITELLDEKRFPAKFSVNGSDFSFIVFAPQTKIYPATADIVESINYLKANYRVDTTRIYLSGLSVGGVVICDVAASIPEKIAAIVPFSGVSRPDSLTKGKCQLIAKTNLPVWAFQNNDDPVINSSETKSFISLINEYLPPIKAKLTLWPSGGHDSWTKGLNPDYRENGFNIYEWMLQYHR